MNRMSELKASSKWKEKIQRMEGKDTAGKPVERPTLQTRWPTRPGPSHPKKRPAK
jgi:hypothetical protein